MSSDQESTLKDGYQPRAVEEASAWLALLHGPRRTHALEDGFRRWIAASPQHEAAFDAVTAMWDATAGLAIQPLPPQSVRQAVGLENRGPFGRLVAVGAALVTVALLFYMLHSNAISTAIGEQRMLTLEDGTRVYLNTNSRVRIQYSKERRGVVLESGEALFDVARRGAQWPFVVTVGARQVTALGTAFVVREEHNRLAITLIEGNVAVSSVAAAASEEPRVLTPGQRVTFARQRPPMLDHPAVEQITAWRQGRVELDDTPLEAAVAEMNRYSTTVLRIERAEARSIAVKGAFRSGDVESFAQSIAATCHLRVVPGPGEILLAGVPSASCRE